MLVGTKLGLTAAAVLVSGGVSGCYSEPPPDPAAMPPHTAKVSINGNLVGDRFLVTCNQIQWLLTIEAVDEATGFTAMIDKGAAPDAKFVKIRDLGGFTGSAWEGGVGDVEASRDDGIFTLAGTGYGYFADNPGRQTTAAFTISTTC